MKKVVSLQEYKNAKEGIVSPLEVIETTKQMIQDNEVELVAVVIMRTDGTIDLGSSAMDHLSLIGMLARGQRMAEQDMEDAEEELWDNE